MTTWIITEDQDFDKEAGKHAGGKARDDLRAILLEYGAQEKKIVIKQTEASIRGKVFYHFRIARQWKNQLSETCAGDTIIFQFPPIHHSLFLADVLKDLVERGVRIIAFIHDMEILRHCRNATFTLRKRWCMKKEEVDTLKLFNGIVVHNTHMKKLLHQRFGIPEQKMEVLDIFDYLASDDYSPTTKITDYHSCIIAGNLSKRKASYVYHLPDSPAFELYGICFEGIKQDNIHYHGSFFPDELPCRLEGGFGLVWDGDSIETCSGPWGEYLQYNNPHKTSLYLASGIPVITWNKAAIADFIMEQGCGFTVRNLNEISQVINRITPEEYLEMRKNAEKLSKKIRDGYFTKKALTALNI